MSVDTAFRVFVDANPVPDPALLTEEPERDVLLAATLQRSTEMQTQEPMTTSPKERPPRRNLILATAAIAIAVIVGLVVFLPEDDPQVGDQQPVPTTTPTPVTEPEVPTTLSVEEATLAANTATLEAMIAARNSGDFEEWVSYLADEAEVFASPDPASWTDWQRAVMAANEQWTIDGECRSTTPSTRFVCPMTLRNDFHGPAGLYFTVPAMVIMFDDSGKIDTIVTDNWDIAGEPEEYNSAFEVWIANAYPDAYATFGPSVEGEGGLPNAEAMPTALEYVDEFIAQSDIYPLQG